jgi:hypothetical protein
MLPTQPHHKLYHLEHLGTFSGFSIALENHADPDNQHWKCDLGQESSQKRNIKPLKLLHRQ